MQTILIELKNSKAFEALYNLEKENIIRILSDNLASYCLPGKPLDEDEFKSWVEYAENTPTLSLNEAKKQWEKRKKKLLSITK